MRALLLFPLLIWPVLPARAGVTPGNRVASVYISQTIINDLIHENLKTPLLQDVSVALDPAQGQIVLRGLAKIPVEELRAINIDEGLGDFRFQVVIKPKTTRQGHLILVFPLQETFFYPASSRTPEKDRIIVPVQLLSLALASARGYLAALSGDFSGFDRKTRELRAQIVLLDHDVAAEKDAEKLDLLKSARRGLELQLEAVPIERRQLMAVAKALEKVVGFTGEGELKLNQELAAHRNALVLRLKLAQLAPYLAGVELGGVRILKDKRDGGGENFLAVDVEAQLDKYEPAVASSGPARQGAPKAPLVVVRLHQSIFESTEIVGVEQKELGDHVRNFSLKLKEDGLHATGRWKLFLFPDVPFKAVLELVPIAPNVFDIRVRDMIVEHIELRSLTKLVLESAKSRLDRTLKGLCTFQYVGEEKDKSRAIRVTVDMPHMLPAFPKLSLLDIATSDGELVLKAGLP